MKKINPKEILGIWLTRLDIRLNFIIGSIKKYKIELSQDDYVGSSSVITLAGVNLSYRQNDNILVSQLDIHIVNTGDFNQFDDLLNNNIREWQCILYKDAEVYFQGWIVVDVIEQQFIDNPVIKNHLPLDELIKLQDIEVETATFGEILNITIL